MKKKILAVMLSAAMIMANSTTAFAVTTHPGAIPGTSTIENQNNNSYLDYISTCAFSGKTVYLEDIPFSATGDGSDTEGVIVNIGDSIMSKDYGTYPTEAVMEVRIFNNSHYEGAWAYISGYQETYIVGIGENYYFTLSDEDLAANVDSIFEDASVNDVISEYQIITNNGTVTKWKAFRRKFSDSDGVFVKIVPAM